MSASAEFVSHIAELLAPLGPLTQGRFFGGHAFKASGRQFAMVMGNVLYFCVDAQSRAEYEARGSTPFAYTTRERVVQVRRYYAAPAELLDDHQALLAWARRAICAAGGA